MTEAAEVGTCPCPLCAAASSVRKFATGRRKGQLYLVCAKHSQFINYGGDFQEWILEHMTAVDSEGQRQPPHFVAPPNPVPDPISDPISEAAPVPPPAPPVAAPKPARTPSVFIPVLFAR